MATTPTQAKAGSWKKRLPNARYLTGAVVFVSSILMVERARLWLLLIMSVALIVAAIGVELRLADRRRREIIGLLIDSCMAMLLAFISPSTWMLALVAVMAQVVWQGLTSSRSWVSAYAIPNFVLLGLAGVLWQPANWVGTFAVAIAFSLLFASLGDTVRSRTLSVQDDLAELLSAAGALVHFSDGSLNTTTHISGPLEQVTGWTSEEWATIDHREIIHPDDLDQFWVDTNELTPGVSFDRKARFQRPDGSYAWLRDISRVVTDSNGRIGLRGFTIDSTELEEAHELIRYQASTDQLTGLSNRYVLGDRIDGLLADGAPFALLLLDLDRFKAINDTLGHEVGDQVLEHMASRLQSVTRGADTIVRLGGDEFAIVIPGVDNDERATTFARSVAAACDEVMAVGDLDLTVEISVGVALAPRDGCDANTLLRHADLAMYDAKSKGTSHRMYDGSIHAVPVEHLRLSSEINEAMETEDLLLHFQPKVDIPTGAITGFEGLARWNHPALGLLSPDRFIDLVTVSNHSQAFAFHVLEQGIKFAARCASIGRAVPIAVNLAARSLYDPQIPQHVSDLLERYGVDASQLVVEVTEQDIMDSSGQASSVVSEIAALGVGISIDDFGTGYSSLARLADLPVSEIKVDQRFVAALDREASCVIVRSIIDLGRNLGLSVVAEGVEEERQAVALSRYGVTSAQGYLFARPAEPDTALALLTGERLLAPTG